MKFLHEVDHINSVTGEKVYNGWWEIRGSYLYNYAGGRHSYTPSADDEIIESTWNEILKLNFLKNDEITGWVAPDGEFFGCDYGDHALLADVIFNSSISEMEKDGFCMIYWNRYAKKEEEDILLDLMIPEDILKNIASSGERGDYDYYCDTPLTAAQKRVLQEKGVRIKEEEDV